MSATRELLTQELTSIEEKLAVGDLKRLGEGIGMADLKRRRYEIASMLEQLQPSDAMRDPRILRG